MKYQDFTLSHNEDQIPWRLFTPDIATKEYIVLWLQGWTSSMDSHREGVERMSGETGIAFATMDYAGHGLHKVPLEVSTKKQQHEEVVAVFDELKRRGYDKIIVIGGSFGGYMTALLTSKRPVHTAFLRAPANYVDAEFDLPYSETLRNKNHDAYLEAKSTDDAFVNTLATRSFQDYDGFVYVLEHELDDQVPARIPRRYFDLAKHGNYLIIPKTKHSPKLMENPKPHFAYIEHVVVSIIEAVRLQDTLK